MASKTTKFFGNLAQFGLPIIGGILGGPGGAALGGAAGGALSGKKGTLAQAGLGAVGGYAGSKLTNSFGAPTTGNPFQKVGGAIKSGLGLGNIGSSIMNMFGGGNAYAAAPGVAGAAGGAASAIPGGVVGTGAMAGLGNSPALAPAGNATTASSLNPLNLFGNKTNLLGAGSIALGLMKGYPKVPDLPQSVTDIRSQIQNGGSPLGQFGQDKLTGLMNQNYDPLSEPEIEASLRQLELDQTKAEDQVRDLYRNIRPGSDPSSDSAFRRDLQEVNDQYSRAKADTVAQRTRDTKQNFDNQRLSQIQTAIGASSQDMQTLTQLAQLDVNQISTQLGLDVQQAQLFKETFLNLGASMLTPPSPLEQFLAKSVN